MGQVIPVDFQRRRVAATPAGATAIPAHGLAPSHAAQAPVADRAADRLRREAGAARAAGDALASEGAALTGTADGMAAAATSLNAALAELNRAHDRLESMAQTAGEIRARIDAVPEAPQRG